MPTHSKPCSPTPCLCACIWELKRKCQELTFYILHFCQPQPRAWINIDSMTLQSADLLLVSLHALCSQAAHAEAEASRRQEVLEMSRRKDDHMKELLAQHQQVSALATATARQPRCSIAFRPS